MYFFKVNLGLDFKKKEKLVVFVSRDYLHKEATCMLSQCIGTDISHAKI